MAAGGLTNEAVATQLGITMPTVNTYWARIREKLGHANRAELVAHFVHSLDEVEANALREANEKLTQELRAKEDAVGMFEALLSAAPDPVLIVDADGVIQRANREAGALFLYDPAEMAGMRIGRLMPESMHEAHRAYRRAYLEAMPGRLDVASETGVASLRSDGTTVRVALHLNAVETPLGKMVVCFFRELRS